MGPDSIAAGRVGDGGLRRPAGGQPRRIRNAGSGSHHRADGNAGAANAYCNCGPDADFYAAAYSNSGADHHSDANPAAYCDANAIPNPNRNPNARTYAAARCAAGSHRGGHLHR